MTRMTQPAGSARSPFLVPRQKRNVDRESCRELTVRNIPAVKRLSPFSPVYKVNSVSLQKKKNPERSRTWALALPMVTLVTSQLG